MTREDAEDMMETGGVPPLPEQIAIERVIDGDETKTFVRDATVLVIDGTVPKGYKDDVEVYFNNPVPVKADDGKLLGFVTLRREGRFIEGEFFLDYNSPQRLEIETGSKKLFPYAAGVEALSLVEGEDEERVVSMHIMEVHLRPEEPLDPRIEPL